MWPKKAIDWIEDGTAFVSVPFTWELPQAYSRCVFLREQGYHVRAGGPAVSLIPDYLKDVASIGGEVNALKHHNPNAVFTSRGCIRKCKFCAVPRIEGRLVELATWEPKPIVCDNNLLACSKNHFNRVIDSLRGIKDIDFNQGLDARLLTQYHVDRLTELDLRFIRFAWDYSSFEMPVMRAIERARKAGIPKAKIRIYVLIGYDDTPEDALYRLQRLRDMRISPNVQRYQPLDALHKNSYVHPNWTGRELHRFSRYWNRERWLAGIPFGEYRG